MNSTQALAAIGVMALVTIILRFLPFILLGKRKTPAFLEYLGKVLPYSVMAMLVVYCLKDISITNAFPQIISVLVVAALHVWKRNTLLSIVAGTVCYMVLIRVM